MSARSDSPFDLYQVTESGLYLRDNTTANVSTSKHGLAPKLPNDATKYLDGTGAYTVPPGSSQGALIFRERHAASSSASLDFTTFLSGTYDKYLIVGENLINATNATDLLLRVGTGGGPTYDTGLNYDYANWRYASSTATGNGASGASAYIRLFSTARNSGGDAINFSLTATCLQSTASRKYFFGTGAYIDNTGPLLIGQSMLGTWNTSGTAATALTFLSSSGNITSGSITIYGYTNS